MECSRCFRPMTSVSPETEIGTCPPCFRDEEEDARLNPSEGERRARHEWETTGGHETTNQENA